ncbi:hypothetical protein [Escherichia phage phiWec190]|nr:hypothetical protein [Escherichia phage phiWec188]BDU13808.1 hypothetical protein [Escherichia phage phiWec190]
MAYPDYIDERATGFFRNFLVGRSHGDGGSSYKTSWDSQCGAKATKTLKMPGRPLCAYCGNEALSLQPGIEHGDYDIKGYTCVCKGAMDEADWVKEKAEMEERHRREVYEMEKRMPIPDLQVKKDIVAKMMEKVQKAETEQELNRAIENLRNFKEEKELREIMW